MIKDHREGYLSWEHYERNQRAIEANRRAGAATPGAAREGTWLLQGLVLCARCGRSMKVNYQQCHDTGDRRSAHSGRQSGDGRLHPERDVVLLNSDTEVADGWLDRLAACARREGVGTATPFSSNATIASYPRFARPNALPDGASTAALDAVFARMNAGRLAARARG